VGRHLASSWLTIAVQTAGGALTAVELPLYSRLLLAERAVGFYLAKFVWPTNLAPYYPLPDHYSLLGADFLASALVCVAISVGALLYARRAPLLLASWLAFGVMLAPVVGLLQVGSQAAADRYMYLPMLALLLPLGALSMRALDAGVGPRRAVLAAGVTIAVLLSFLSLRQIGIWYDTISLWEHEIALYPDATTPRHNLGLGYSDAGKLEAAREQWETALALEPGHKWAATDLGNLERSRGAFEAAEALYRSAIASDPYFAVAHLNLAVMLDQQGRSAEAIEHYRVFVRIAPPQYAEVAAQVRARLSGY
jgi:tetratricopeptide (TPR) repeat protein